MKTSKLLTRVLALTLVFSGIMHGHAASDGDGDGASSISLPAIDVCEAELLGRKMQEGDVSDSIRVIIKNAERIAEGRGHAEMTEEHLFLGVVQWLNSGNPVFNRRPDAEKLHKPLTGFMGEHGAEFADAAAAMEARLDGRPRDPGASTQPPPSDNVRNLLEAAVNQFLVELPKASGGSPEPVTPDILLLALTQSPTEDFTALLAEHGITRAMMEEFVATSLPGRMGLQRGAFGASTGGEIAAGAGAGAQSGNPQLQEALPNVENWEPGQALETFGKRVTPKPAVGVQAQIAKVASHLASVSTPNAMVLGPAGTGKTALVEALQLAIELDEVPSPLKGAEIIQIDILEMVGGTTYRGMFEARITALKNDILAEGLRRNEEGLGPLIIFIDEMHKLKGAGSTMENSNGDAASMLLEPLSRPEESHVQMIGATTWIDFRAHLAGEEAFIRRFGRVYVEPTSLIDTMTILGLLQSGYEEHHGVTYTEAAIQRAAFLGARVMNIRTPASAIQILDRAASFAVCGDSTLGTELAELERRIHMVESRWQTDNYEVMKELASLRQRRDQILERIRGQAPSGQRASLEQELAALRREHDRLLETGRTEEAGELASGRISEISVELEALGEASGEASGEAEPLVIDVAQVDEAVENLTGRPVSRTPEEMQQILSAIGSDLPEIWVGPNSAREAVADELIAAASPTRELDDGLRGAFLVVGPPGGNGTSLGSSVAQVLFPGDSLHLRVNAAMYSGPGGETQLLGAPFGVSGAARGGPLNNFVTERGTGVVSVQGVHHAPDLMQFWTGLVADGSYDDPQGNLARANDLLVFFDTDIMYDTIANPRASLFGVLSEAVREDKRSWLSMFVGADDGLVDALRASSNARPPGLGEDAEFDADAADPVQLLINAVQNHQNMVGPQGNPTPLFEANLGSAIGDGHIRIVREYLVHTLKDRLAASGQFPQEFLDNVRVIVMEPATSELLELQLGMELGRIINRYAEVGATIEITAEARADLVRRIMIDPRGNESALPEVVNNWVTRKVDRRFVVTGGLAAGQTLRIGHDGTEFTYETIGDETGADGE